MKKLYFLVIASCLFNWLNAQTIVFGSVAFKDRLLSANSTNGFAKDKDGKSIVIDTNFDKEIDATEASKVFFLELGGTKSIIYNLKGIDFFINLKTLNFYGQRVTADLRALKNLEVINCGGDLVTADLNINGLDLKQIRAESSSTIMPYLLDQGPNGISQFKNLEILFLGNDKLESLNLLELKLLKTLVITKSKITSLNLNGLSNLQWLDCSYNLLANLDLTGCSSISYLNAANNKLSSFSLDGNLNVQSLNLSNNTLLEDVNIKNISTLKDINLNNCILKKLDLSDLKLLESVYCNKNKLSSLNLKDCSSLLTLDCSYNELTDLDFSMCSKLNSFSGNYNSFKTLDFSILSLENIQCSNNSDLDFFSIKNGKKINESSLSFSNNPKLKYICVDDSEIDIIQSKILNYGYTKCHANSYCSFTPSNDFYVIQGNQKIDYNKNGCDDSDLLMKNLKLKITGGANSGTVIANSEGNYWLPVEEGSYRITPVLENPNYFLITPAFVNVSFPKQNSPFQQNFCISLNGMHPDLEILIIPLGSARPGFDADYKIIYKNKGNQVQSGSVDLAFNDDVLDLILSKPAGSAQGNNKLSWNFNELKPFETREITFTVNVNSPMETPAVNNGDILKFTATIMSNEKDDTPLDNTFTLSQTVVGSYDPNDKTCLEGTVITPNLIGEYVHYMIRFENTGTYPAQNIVVKDIIDFNKFDISTLIPTSSSHSFVTKISEGNKVEFIFENINLPYDDANNDGYITFKIKTKPTLKVGDSFTNEANIYFDYNFPILTNKATSTFKTVLGTTDFDFSKYFVLYPNPSNQILNISQTDNIEVQSFEIYDVLGQLIIAVPNAKTTSNIDVSKLQTGNYFIKVKSDKGSSSMKFIKI